MYRYYRYMNNPYSLYFPSLQEYLDKGRKNHIFYGKKYSIKKDGYYDYYHEFGKHLLRDIRNDPRYVRNQILQRFNELGSDINMWLRCFINMNNPDEYMVVLCSKKGSKRNEIAKRIFTVLKDD